MLAVLRILEGSGLPRRVRVPFRLSRDINIVLNNNTKLILTRDDSNAQSGHSGLTIFNSDAKTLRGMYVNRME